MRKKKQKNYGIVLFSLEFIDLFVYFELFGAKTH